MLTPIAALLYQQQSTIFISYVKTVCRVRVKEG